MTESKRASKKRGGSERAEPPLFPLGGLFIPLASGPLISQPHTHLTLPHNELPAAVSMGLSVVPRAVNNAAAVSWPQTHHPM